LPVLLSVSSFTGLSGEAEQGKQQWNDGAEHEATL
jgi:hypothetical protein